MVVDEYIDAGESARSADRPQLQAMLERLTRERDIDLVIVHKVDRLARNRTDDVAINVVIRDAGARLVSVSENIDETPSGILLHGIMSSIAEFYSRNLATEIKKGMDQKAKKGHHPGLAPLGYLNAREISDGQPIRTITTDPERAELVRWTFEAYASGDYTIDQLVEALADKGLRTRPTAKRPARRLERGYVHKMLHNPFYIGLVTWGGAQHPGKHEPLVALETYAAVQALLISRARSGEKSRSHPHYLKGTILCGRCGSRICFGRSRGNGGQYDYFFCLGRHQRRNDCQLPHLAVADVEEGVADYYRTIRLSESTLEALRGKLIAAMKRRTAGAEKRADQQRKRVARLENERRRLLQAHLAGAIEIDLLKEEQARVTQELANAGAALAANEIDWTRIEANLEAALELASRIDEAYRKARPATRRQLNQIMFREIRIDVDGVSGAQLADPFAQLLADDLLVALEREMKNRRPSRDDGSKDELLVEVMGLEP